METRIPDFFLGSNESDFLRDRRECYVIKRIHAVRRDDYLLIKIKPPLDLHARGVPEGETDRLIIASRHKGETLFPVEKWPLAVYVLLPQNEDPEKRLMLKDNEISLIGWAEIYKTEDA